MLNLISRSIIVANWVTTVHAMFCVRCIDSPTVMAKNICIASSHNDLLTLSLLFTQSFIHFVIVLKKDKSYILLLQVYYITFVNGLIL